MTLNERFGWAVTILDIRPKNQVLEIGCGAGLLVEQIANEVDGGHVTAIDRSAAMIKMASKRNRDSISAGKVTLLNVGFVDSDFKKSQFDIIVAFNVNFFWKNPLREFEIIRRILKPGGMLYIFYQAPFEISIDAAEPIKSNLKNHSFETIDTVLKKMKPTSAFCVKAGRGKG